MPKNKFAPAAPKNRWIVSDGKKRSLEESFRFLLKQKAVQGLMTSLADK